jgi:hypothetical protein
MASPPECGGKKGNRESRAAIGCTGGQLDSDWSRGPSAVCMGGEEIPAQAAQDKSRAEQSELPELSWGAGGG